MRWLEVGGFTPLSTTDWPGRLAAVVFVQGCPWRCSYCHNPGLQARGAGGGPHWPQLMQRLARRVGLLDGVVFSGGEPTLDARLGEAVQQVRELGFEVGLHTAGIYPERLAELLPALAWVGLDIKTDFAAYHALTACPDSGRRAHESLALLAASGVDYEVRTTYHPALIDDSALLATARALGERGVRRWVLQQWRASQGDATAGLAPWHWPDAELAAALSAAGPSPVLR